MIHTLEEAYLFNYTQLFCCCFYVNTYSKIKMINLNFFVSSNNIKDNTNYCIILYPKTQKPLVLIYNLKINLRFFSGK